MDQFIQQIVAELKNKISEKFDILEFIVFGSTARRERRPDSDIDVFVRLSHINRQIEEALFDIAYEVELKYDCLIDIIVFGNDAVSKKLEETPVYQKVLEEGVAV